MDSTPQQTDERPAIEIELTDGGQRLVEAAYRDRSRPKCSREDFSDGYIAALIDCGHWAFFEPGTRERLLDNDGAGG